MRIDPQRIIDEFNAKAPVYESNRLAPWYIAQSELVLASARGAHLPPGNILDIGCATGWLARSLARQFPDRNVLGLDLAPRMIEQAKSLAPPESKNLEFEVANWEAWTSRAANSHHQFSLVTCASAFHYFADPSSALKRIYASLVPHGLLVLVERDTTRSMVTALWGFLHRRVIKDHVIFYNRNEMLEMAEQTGFAECRIYQRIRKYFWKGKLQTQVAILHARRPAS